MLIRTQDKRMLIPIDNLIIFLDYRKLTDILASSPNCDNENNYYTLGSYETEERTMDILDDIQETLKHCFYEGIVVDTIIPNFNSGIYTMPEK